MTNETPEALCLRLLQEGARKLGYENVQAALDALAQHEQALKMSRSAAASMERSRAFRKGPKEED